MKKIAKVVNFWYNINGLIKTLGGTMQENIIMVCTECKMENYITKKNKRNHPDRMDLKKFCPKCNKSTTHREKKK